MLRRIVSSRVALAQSPQSDGAIWLSSEFSTRIPSVKPSPISAAWLHFLEKQQHAVPPVQTKQGQRRLLPRSLSGLIAAISSFPKSWILFQIIIVSYLKEGRQSVSPWHFLRSSFIIAWRLLLSKEGLVRIKGRITFLHFH